MAATTASVSDFGRKLWLFCNEFCHYWVFMVSSECWHFWRPFGSSPEIRHIWQLLVKSTWQPTGCSAPPQRPLCRQWTVTSRMTDLPTLTSWWRHLSDDDDGDNYDDDDDDDANEVNNSDASWTVITHCTACSVFAEACGTNGAQGDTRTRKPNTCCLNTRRRHNTAAVQHSKIHQGLASEQVILELVRTKCTPNFVIRVRVFSVGQGRAAFFRLYL